MASPGAAGVLGATPTPVDECLGEVSAPLVELISTGAYCTSVMLKGAEGPPEPVVTITGIFAPSGASTGISIVIWGPFWGGIRLKAFLPPTVTNGLMPRAVPVMTAWPP